MNKTATKLTKQAASIKEMLEATFEITAKVTIGIRAGMARQGAKALMFRVVFSGYATPMMIQNQLHGINVHVQKED